MPTCNNMCDGVVKDPAPAEEVQPEEPEAEETPSHLIDAVVDEVQPVIEEIVETVTPIVEE